MIGLPMRLASLAALAFLIAAALPAHAYTAADAKNCMQFAFKLCRAAIPHVDKVARCMQENRGRLSPACAEAVDRFFSTGLAAKRGKPVVYKE
ncbi:MAG TPA: hypothetical protein VL492_08785 [Methylovirgula sp.]|jgi:hypothetical protein|nr:hypothetical protein [Methylovirgula sp.]